ncbi:vitelline membrane outer layer protein 1-like [Palaemon carinicauda]|uniref:vitelline membrane outer layer protein 1-like n=1 Tax=Palaemon carinicauda TaxID=392227 RepID=UPI0035B57C74
MCVISSTSGNISVNSLLLTDMLRQASLCVLFSYVLLGIAANRPTTKTLFLDNGFDAGKWGEDEFCEEGSFAMDIEVKYKVHNVLHLDENAVNAVKLYCSKPDGTMANYITSTEGEEGTWQGMKSCSHGLMTGVRAKILPNKGLFGDDEAMQNVEMECDGGLSTILAMPEHANFSTVNWSSWDKCGRSSAVCGIKIRYEPPNLVDDDVAVSDMTLYCCSLN